MALGKPDRVSGIRTHTATPTTLGSLGWEAEAEPQPSTALGSSALDLQPFRHLHTPLREGARKGFRGSPRRGEAVPPSRPRCSAASPGLRAPSGALLARPLPRQRAADCAGQRGARPGTLPWLLRVRSDRTPRVCTARKPSPGRAGIRGESRAGSERAELRAPGASCPPPARPGAAGAPRGTPAPRRPSLQLPCALLAIFSQPLGTLLAALLPFLCAVFAIFSHLPCHFFAPSLQSPCTLLARSVLFLCALHTVPLHPNSLPPS